MAGLLVVTPPGPEADALCATLLEQGFEVHQAGSGEGAIDEAARLRPDAILLDAALSATERWHTVKQLGSEPDTSRIPVVTLAPGAGVQRALSRIERTVGALPRRESFDDPTLPQPERPALIAVPSPQRGHGTSPMPVQRRSERCSVGRVLVVDDNSMSCDMLVRRLERKGYDVVGVSGGRAALAALEEPDRFDLVLLDRSMPDMSGIAVLERIRERYGPTTLPVILIDARDDADAVAEALRAEANDFLSKPLSFEIVDARIRAQLRLAEAHREQAANERLLRAVLDNVSELVLLHRPDGEMLYVSPSSRQLLGYEPAELSARPFQEWLHPLDRRSLEAKQAPQPPQQTFLARMRARDGRWRWMEAVRRNLRHEGEPAILITCRDVSEHMERISDDEPPLPLGGDVASHPGWRTAQRPPTLGAPKVLTFVIGATGLPIDELSRHVSDELRRALSEVGDEGGDG